MGSALGAGAVTWIGFNVFGTGMLVKFVTALLHIPDPLIAEDTSDLFKPYQ